MRTVRQLQEVDENNRVGAIGRVTNLPLDRLRKALNSASAPSVRRIEPVHGAGGESAGEPPLLRVTGRNLVRQGQFPQVRIGNRPVSILKSSAGELLIAPADGQWAGELTIEPSPQRATAMSFDLSAFAPAAPSPAQAPAAALAIPPVPTGLAVSEQLQ